MLNFKINDIIDLPRF